MFSIILITHKLNGIVGLQILEHCCSVGRKLLGTESIEQEEIYFKDNSNISRVFLSLPSLYTSLKQGSLSLLEKLQQYLIQV